VSELQIEEGKWYRRRDGQVVGPAWHRGEPSLYPWCLGKLVSGHTIYLDNGRYNSVKECERDLVEEVPAPLPQHPVDVAIASELDIETAASTFGPLEQYVPADSPWQPAAIDPDGAFEQAYAEAAGVAVDTLPRRAVDIAGKAASLVGGDRDRQHGAKHDNFRRIAGVWNAWLSIRKEPSAPLDAHDVGCMMALMKLARTQSGALNVDDYVDACGYAACAGEVAQISEP
jgi:hypothetical protein